MHCECELISLSEAASLGILRVRMPGWANHQDYIKIDVVNGNAGIWCHFYSPINKDTNGRNPIDTPTINLGGIFVNKEQSCFVAYGGAISEDER